MLEYCKNLIGQQFNMLIVVELINIRRKTDTSKTETFAICKCDCGIIKSILFSDVRLDRTKSCGCLSRKSEQYKSEIYKNLFIGEYNSSIWNKTKFGKLRVMGPAPSENIENFMVLCKCDCGNTISTKLKFLLNGKARSCGCFLQDERYLDCNIQRKQEPWITSARSLFVSSKYKDGDLTFEQFLELTQHKCHYCEAPPNNHFNIFKSKKYGVSKYALENGTFIYNGLDRVDNTKPHDFNNVVPCCHPCNFAKSDRTIEEFAEWALKINKWADCFIKNKDIKNDDSIR